MLFADLFYVKKKNHWPGVVGHGLVDELHLDLVEYVLEIVLARGQLQLLVPVVGALEHDDVAVHQLVQYLAACTRLNPSDGTVYDAAERNGSVFVIESLVGLR